MRLFPALKVYLDYASGALMKKSALSAVYGILNKKLGNPSSIHSFGAEPKTILENSRKIIADSISANSNNIIFTSSATESIAMAIHGTVMSARVEFSKPHIITSTIEHSAILKNCELLEKNNLAEVTYIKPDDSTGLIGADSIVKNIKPNTVLVSIHSVNSEIGIMQDIGSYVKALNSYKENKYGIKNMRFTNKSYYPYLHIDATQDYVHNDISSHVLKGVDLISFNSVKIGGPAGVGVLYRRINTEISPMYAGGSQEFGFRPGTVSVHDIYAFACTASIHKKQIDKLESKYAELKKYLLGGIRNLSSQNNFDFVENSSENSVPSIVSISFPYFSGQQMAVELDARGVAVSSKSACNTGDAGESYVVWQIRNISEEKTYNNYGTIRISFGPETKKSHIDKLLKSLQEIINTYKGVLY